ncbi:MAG: alpha/beta fold hydrolase [bacterium]
MEFKKIHFENTSGERLAARLDFPADGKPKAFALFAHCFTCTKNLKAISHISKALTQAGIAVLRFDFTGLGESEGDFADTNFSSNVTDLVAAADFLTQQYAAPKILVGHSLGGAAVLQAAADIPSSVAVATIGAPCNPQHVTHLLESKRHEIESAGEAVVSLAGRQFKIKKQFLDDLEARNMTARIRNLKRALLIFHSPVDATVGIENAAHIFESAKHPKSFVSLDRADHLLSNASDSFYVGAVVAAWSRKYVDLRVDEVEQKASVDDGVYVQTGRTGFQTDILANGHALLADEPVAFGGTNTGPTPYDLLLAALGACTSMTLRMYADRKQWPLESIGVKLKHSKIHANDCENCEAKEGKIDRIERSILLSGALDTAQKQRLLEIADRCPVHRTLHSEIKVETFLADRVD